MREITGSVKVAVKCLIAVVLPYWTSKVEHLVVYAAIVSNILLRMRRNGYLETSAKSFGDLVTFSVDFFPFYMLNVIQFPDTDLITKCKISAMICIRGTSHGPVSVCVCVCLSVTSRISTKTAKQRITQTTPHYLVFWCQRSPRNSTGVTPYEGAECRWGGSKSATFDK